MEKDFEIINLSLETTFIGKKIYHYKRISSTQKVAITFAETNSDIENGTVILADEQYDGKGRGNKKWISPKGGLWLSLIIKPKMELSKINMLPLIVSISTCEAINKIGNLETRIKWPNDIVIHNKKIAGLIIDSSITNNHINYIVIGIGINIMVDISIINLFLSLNDNFLQKATSLENEVKEKCLDRFLLLKHLLERVEYYLFLVQNEPDATKIVKIYKKLSNSIGKSLSIFRKDSTKYTATAIDIDIDGSLILQRENKIIEKIHDEEISIREKEQL